MPTMENGCILKKISMTVNYFFSISSCLYVSNKGSWTFTFFYDLNPKAVENDFLILSISVSIVSLLYGSIKSSLALTTLKEGYASIKKDQIALTEGTNLEEIIINQNPAFGKNESEKSDISKNDLAEIRLMFHDIKVLIADLHPKTD